jgi:hypothetical protein
MVMVSRITGKLVQVGAGLALPHKGAASKQIDINLQTHEISLLLDPRLQPRE